MSGFRSAVGGGPPRSGQGAKPGGGSAQPPPKKSPPTEKTENVSKSNANLFSPTNCLLVVGLAMIGGMIFADPKILRLLDVRLWPHWYWPVLGVVVAGIVLLFIFSNRIAIAMRNDTPCEQLCQLRRLTLITVIGLVGVLVVIHTRLAAALSSVVGNMFSSNAPWWAWPTFWGTAVVGLFVTKLVMASREARLQNPQNTGVREQPRNMPPQTAAAVAPAKQKTFNAVTSKIPAAGRSAAGARMNAKSDHEKWSLSDLPGMSALADLGPIVWWCAAGVIIFIILVWFGYWYTTTEWIDKEGYPISKPWWIWPILFALIGCVVFVIRMMEAIHEGAAAGAFRRDKPTVRKPAKPQKPAGFNMQRKQ